jgi:ADP-heptose:LPS heptosyltransferase
MKLQTVHKTGNVYNSAQQFFQANDSIALNNSFTTDNILVFPDSRKKKKIIPESILLKLNKYCNSNQTELTTAFFGTSSVSKKDIVFYNDFETLVQLIKEAHFIISSDSVTAHLAQYFNKPHFILYPDKVNFEWLTPWAAEMNMYTTFDEEHVLFNKIDKA